MVEPTIDPPADQALTARGGVIRALGVHITQRLPSRSMNSASSGRPSWKRYQRIVPSASAAIASLPSPLTLTDHEAPGSGTDQIGSPRLPKRRRYQSVPSAKDRRSGAIARLRDVSFFSSGSGRFARRGAVRAASSALIYFGTRQFGIAHAIVNHTYPERPLTASLHLSVTLLAGLAPVSRARPNPAAASRIRPASAPLFSD